LVSLAVVVAALASASSMASAATPQQVKVQILGVNDFHGAVDQVSKVSNRNIGGAAYLAAWMNQRESLESTHGAQTLRVGVGDMIGASQPVSALLKEEPAIEVLSAMKLKYSAVGNHEFDKGLKELRRLQYGNDYKGQMTICHCSPAWAKRQATLSGTPTSPFKGAGFQYLAANVVDEKTNNPVFPPYAIEKVNGVPIAFIGVVKRDAPTIVTPEGTAGLKFTDEATAVNKYVKKLQALNVHTIVVLLHESASGNRNGTSAIGDASVPIINAMDNDVDVVMTAHSHTGLWGYVGTKLVTQAYSSGTAFADVDLVIDPKTRDVVSKSAAIVDTWADDPNVPADAKVAKLVADADAKVAPITGAVVGTASAPITRTTNAASESAMGDFIADAQRWKMGTQVAFMNPGGIRADLTSGSVTWGQLFTIQPFNNYMVTMKMSGQQIKDVLEDQWRGTNASSPRVMQVSGITYTYSTGAAAGSKIDPTRVSIGGAPLSLTTTYTVTCNNYMAGGGDGYLTFKSGANQTYGPVDIDALVDYVKQLAQPFSQSIANRIQSQP
jgi:5'-nucleotidase